MVQYTGEFKKHCLKWQSNEIETTGKLEMSSILGKVEFETSSLNDSSLSIPKT